MEVDEFAGVTGISIHDGGLTGDYDEQNDASDEKRYGGQLEATALCLALGLLATVEVCRFHPDDTLTTPILPINTTSHFDPMHSTSHPYPTSSVPPRVP